MSKKPRSKVIAIVGPTASGKSALAIRLAKKLGGEIISADSRQVYRGLDIGTGKVPRDQISNSKFLISKQTPKSKILNSKFFYKGIPHHLLDVASPKRTFTVAKYQKLGRAAIKKILAKGKLPIIVGGTGFYIDALLYNYNLPRVLPNPKLRRALGKKSAAELFAKLKSLDPRRARTIDQYNSRRLIRALEIVISTGKPVPALPRLIRANRRIVDHKCGILKIGIRLPNEELKNRIYARLLVRLRRGMIAEVRQLKRSGVSSKRLEALGLEYRYVNRYLEGMLSKSQMTAELEKEIWRYAKRQMTWWKKDEEVNWIRNENEAGKLTTKFLKN